MNPRPMLVCCLSLLSLLGCASTGTQKWSSSGGDRSLGVVRLSYEYPEFHQPAVSDAQAQALALNRCNGWGYQAAQPIDGQIRQCANSDDGNCNVWMVTREFQCTAGADIVASRLPR